MNSQIINLSVIQAFNKIIIVIGSEILFSMTRTQIDCSFELRVEFYLEMKI